MDLQPWMLINAGVGAAAGVIGKIVWDWLKIRKNNGNGHSSQAPPLLYKLDRDMALLTQTVDSIDSFQNSALMTRLLEESHEMFSSRNEIKIALEKQNIISTEANVLLRDLRDELAKTTSQFAAVAEGLSAALKKLKEK